MQVALSELKVNVGRYVDLANNEDIYITRNGKQVAKIVSIKRNKVSEVQSLFGIAKLSNEYNNPDHDVLYDDLRAQRMDV